jgi:hypothetical protein
MVEAVRTSETSVNFNVTTRRYSPEKTNFRKVDYSNCIIQSVNDDILDPQEKKIPNKDFWRKVVTCESKCVSTLQRLCTSEW